MERLLEIWGFTSLGSLPDHEQIRSNPDINKTLYIHKKTGLLCSKLYASSKPTNISDVLLFANIQLI